MILSILSEILVKRFPVILLLPFPYPRNGRSGNMGIDDFKTGRQLR